MDTNAQRSAVSGQQHLALLALGAVAVGGFAWVRFRQPAPSAPPAPAFKPAHVDLGDQPWGTTVPVTLTFVNPSPTPVKIISAKSSCGCTVITGDAYKNRTVEPSGAVPLEITLDTEQARGAKKRTVTVTLDSGGTATAELNVNVLGTYEVTPGAINFGDLDVDDTLAQAARTVTFRSLGATMKGAPAADCDWLDLATAPRGDKETEVLIEVRKDRLPPGHSTGTVVIQTTDRAVPATSVMVHVNAQAQLTPVPGHVFLRGDAQHSVRFALRDGSYTIIRSAESDDVSIVASVNGDGIVSVRNASAKVLPAPVAVRVRDATGRAGRVLVTTFPGSPSVAAQGGPTGDPAR